MNQKLFRAEGRLAGEVFAAQASSFARKSELFFSENLLELKGNEASDLSVTALMMLEPIQEILK